jgi:DNA-binding response OmpR family regulator
MSDKEILLVDDDPVIREVLKAGIESAGFQALVAEDGPNALELFEQRKPVLMIVDLAMPGMDGYELIQAVRALETSHHTPIIVLTAHEGDVMRDYAAEVGGDLYLLKPIKSAELLSRIRELMAH